MVRKKQIRNVDALAIESLLERKIDKRPDKVRLAGRILFLTEDPELIKKQLSGWDLPWDTKNPATIPSCATTSRPTKSRPRTTAFTSTRRWARFRIWV